MKIFLRLTIVAMLVFAASGSYLFAQQDQYQFDLLDVRNGLSGNQINSIYKDEKGFMWIGTMSGLNRYNGYSFKAFKHKAGDSTSISDDYIMRVNQGPHHTLWVLTRNGWNVFDPRTEKFLSHFQNFLSSVGFTDEINTIGIPGETFTSIVQDKQQNFWFVLSGKGLYKCNPAVNKTVLYNKSNKLCPLYSNNVTSVTVDGAGFIWVSYSNGIIEKIDGIANKVVYRTNELQKYSQNQLVDYQLFADSNNDIWIYNNLGIKGVYYYKASSNYILPIQKDTKGLHLNNNIVRGMVEDNKGNIWIATDHGGVNLINKKSFTIRYLVNNENDSKSLSQNSVNAIYKDNDDIIWLGTYKKGLNYFHESSLKFPLYQHRANNLTSLVYNDVNRFVEDKKGNLWIGTNGGGLIYFNRSANTYTQYLHSASANSLSNNVIVSLFIDKEERLWIGTYFGGLDCFDGKKFTNYKHNDNNPNSLADDRVWEVFEDSQNRLWVGTLSQGLDLLDRKSNTFIHHKLGTGNTLHSNYISAIVEDKVGNIWLGTDQGIDVLDKRTGLFRHFEHVENDKTSLSHNNVTDILQDSRGLIWVTTRDGMNVFDPVKRIFRAYRMEEGLPDNTILSILEDNQKNLWLGTSKGLANAIVSNAAAGQVKLQFKNYDEADGLQDRQFNENAALKTRSGELIFGGPNGFNIFQPSKIRENKNIPKLVLTDLQIFNNSVTIGDKYNGKVVLPKSISEEKEISLKYNQNVFTIEFAALDYLNAEKIKYAYKLKGFSSEWLITDGRNRKATFTNLNPGEYTLLVKACNEDGIWSNHPLELKINILPPFWLTPFAFVMYVLVIIAFLFYGRNMILRRAKLKFQIQQERQEAHRLHELDMMKIKFFTNVSHEFRTPLSLIISPVEKLIKQSEQPNDKKQFQLIHRNARRLLNLVNQLLDFRKLEEHELKLNKTSGDIIHFIKEVSHSFSDIAENKQIAFNVHATQNHVFTSFDHDKIERIMFNLLSNSFKFTQMGGAINVYAEVLNTNTEKVLEVKVIDTGIGISKSKQERIFERFFQNEIPGSMVNQGSGIGLSITKEFVKLHGGTITVESEEDQGSCFTVSLPLVPVEEETTNVIKNEIEEVQELSVADAALPVARLKGESARNKKRSLLLVEDNDDFRFYIKDNLKAYYNVIEAENGKTGWQKALAEHPDLIVCDISMPEMNGVDLCKKIKADSRTSFIPVILLTALAGEAQQLIGLQSGASDYMTKPFNFEILLSKIRNLLSQQDTFKKTYQKKVQVQASEVVTQSAGDKFIQQALAVIEKNISNADFSVEEMSREMFMSRVALYKKLFTLSGKTPIEFIRSIRLQRAAQLLEKNEMTVAEVAYEVGFNNPKYFSRYFKQEYNVLPSSYHGKKINSED